MCNLNSELVDKIAESCFNLYKKLPKTGKPVDCEWTVVSCIVKIQRSQEIEVVSLGTGSKCVGATKMSPRGDILNDSHAEVFARRGFLLYLYDNIDGALKNEDSIFNHREGKFYLKNDVEFAFYSSQLPCGDASIVPKSENEDCGDLIHTKHKLQDSCDVEKKKPKLDVHRTGAKCLPDSEQDPKEAGIDYHTLSQVRTKPGRGDRTLSVSCSDKIAKWIQMGIQGSLLSLLCEPIYIKHYIFGGVPHIPYSEESLQRALLNRHSDCEKPHIVPNFYKTLLPYLCVKTETRNRPAPGSIIWVKHKKWFTEVAVQGKKLGLTKNMATIPINSICISKYNLYRRFINVLNMHNDINQAILKDVEIGTVPYNEMKSKATNYVLKWLEVKAKFFKTWTVKPDMWDFCMKLN